MLPKNIRNAQSTFYYFPPAYIDREDLQGNVTLGDWRAHDSNRLHPIIVKIVKLVVIDTPDQQQKCVTH